VEVRILLGAPISSVWSNPAETAASKPARWRFESSHGHQIHRLVAFSCGKPVSTPGSSPRAGFFGRMLHAAVSQLAEEDGLNPFQCRIVACLRHQSRSLSSADQSSGPTNRDRKFESSREHQYQVSVVSGQ
jgi:hypothetical protein